MQRKTTVLLQIGHQCQFLLQKSKWQQLDPRLLSERISVIYHLQSLHPFSCAIPETRFAKGSSLQTLLGKCTGIIPPQFEPQVPWAPLPPALWLSTAKPAQLWPQHSSKFVGSHHCWTRCALCSLRCMLEELNSPQYSHFPLLCYTFSSLFAVLTNHYFGHLS